jgi:hypothetical protein
LSIPAQFPVTGAFSFAAVTKKTKNMKIKIIAAIVLVIAALTAFRPNRSNDAPEKLQKVLTSYFDGITNKDTALMRRVTTADFVLYEDGAYWNNDSAFMNIRRHVPFTVKYTFGKFKTFVDSQSGDIIYNNHADFVFSNDQKVSLDWIESATFRKVNGEWKMNFLQATIKKP